MINTGNHIAFGAQIPACNNGINNSTERTRGFDTAEKLVLSGNSGTENTGLINPGDFKSCRQKETSEAKQSGFLTALSESSKRKILTGVLCGVTLFASMAIVSLPSSYNAAEAAERPAVTVVVNQEARQYGISEATAQKVKDHPTMEATLKSLPKQVIERFKEYSSSQKKVMYKDISGKTSLGVIKVNNREAFVKGSVMGVDVFSQMGPKIEAHAEKGEITKAEAKEMKAGISDLKALSSTQRDAIATLIMWECSQY
ncbi:MAG: hypothetical protein LWY06_20150 [Firmicutes bacterium]|nr:hypothetical protein [Bacillota bacterium]